MPDGRSIGDVGEHSFLERLCERLRARARDRSAPPGADLRAGGGAVLIGPGDDAAVVQPGDRPLAVTTDSLVEGVHFRAGWLTAAELGRKAVAVNLSDLAAMAATPRFVLAAVTAPGAFAAAELDALLDACAAAADEAGAALVGGNLTSGDALSVTVTAIGSVEGRCLARAGARPGDRLLVTGDLGAAAAAVAERLAGRAPSPALQDRWARPVARVAAARALAAAGAHAAIDVSDGLLADVGHLATASGVGARIERDRLPRLPEVAALDAAGRDYAATGGEDYELVFAIPPALAAGGLADLAARAGVALTDVGEVVEATAGVHLVDASGRPVAPGSGSGFDHFAARTSGRDSRETR
ncbi:MAG TPA: thiamine-phosphate kinase [Candidatus Binatia bacterium]|nr:thiamine-phosphate kinase [Candidatus Binatia bacterium]